MSTAVTPRSAPLTPQNGWTRIGQTGKGPLCEFAGTEVTDAVIGALNTLDQSADANFANGSSTPPRWVHEFPGGNYVTHKAFIGVTAGTLAASLSTMGCTFKLAYARQVGKRAKGKAYSLSPEKFLELECALTSSAIAMSAEDKAKYLPSDAPAADWYWVSTYTLVTNAPHGGASVAASVPPTFRYDFNGNAHLFVYGNCVTTIGGTSRAAIACGLLVSGQ